MKPLQLILIYYHNYVSIILFLSFIQGVDCRYLLASYFIKTITPNILCSAFIDNAFQTQLILKSSSVEYITSSIQSHTSITHISYRWWGAEQDAFPQQSVLPQYKDLCTKKMDELRETADRMSHLKKKIKKKLTSLNYMKQFKKYATLL